MQKICFACTDELLNCFTEDHDRIYNIFNVNKNTSFSNPNIYHSLNRNNSQEKTKRRNCFLITYVKVF